MIDLEAIFGSISDKAEGNSETSTPQHSGKKFLLGINRIKIRHKYFKKAQKRRKMTWGKPQMKGHSTKPKIAYPSSNSTLIVRLQIKDAMVSRALIDNGSEVNILFKGVAVRMDILNEVARRTIVQTLKGTPLNTIRTIRLMVRAKLYEHMMTFHVMDSLSPYNAIFGREWLHAMRKIPF